MTENRLIITKATNANLDGIIDLLAVNQIECGGALSENLPRSRVTEMMRDMPLIVALRDGLVTGFLMTSTRVMNANLPLVKAMFNAYHGTPDAYVYGPICVATDQRGKGLAQAMFDKLRTLAPGREGILFISRHNGASLKSHTRMGMREVAEFKLNSSDFAVLSFIG